jgi:hypothetical protein
MSKTLKLLAQEKKQLNVPIGSIGSKLEYLPQPRSVVETFKVDDQYQRLISNSNLKKQGKMDWSLLHPLIIATRPKSLGEVYSGWYVLDGQHKGVKYLNSETEDECPCLVLNHPEGRSYQDCLEVEAKIFSALNTLRKKLNKLEEIRAGVIWKEPEALWVQEVLQSLNLQVDGSFGSDQKNTLELKGFYQFWFLTCDYNHETIGRIIAGYNLWKTMYGSKSKYVNGTTLRALTFIREFLDECLTNGRQETFFRWLTNVLPTNYSQDGLVKPFTDRKSNRYVLYFIFDKYQEYCEANNISHNYRIGDSTLKAAIKATSKYDQNGKCIRQSKFTDPRV